MRLNSFLTTILFNSFLSIILATTGNENIRGVVDDSGSYHILFVGLDGAGDFTPLYNIARGAVQAGHQVTMVNEPVTASRVNMSGMDFIALNTTKEWDEKKWEWVMELSRQRDAAEEGGTMKKGLEMVFGQFYRQQYSFLSSLFSQYKSNNALPHLVVTLGFFVAPMDIAQQYNIKVVTLAPQLNPFFFMGLSTPHSFCGSYPQHWTFTDRLSFLVCRAKELVISVPPIIELETIRAEIVPPSSPPLPFNELLSRHRMIVTSVAGLAQPIPLSPLVEYVGALIDTTNLEGSGFTYRIQNDDVALERVLSNRIQRGLTTHNGEFVDYIRKEFSWNDLPQWLDEQKRVAVFAFGTTGFPSPRFLCSLLSALSQVLSEQNVEPFSVIITQPELSPADLQCREFLGEEDGGEQIIKGEERENDLPPRKSFGHGTMESMQFKGLGDVMMMPWIPQRAVLAHENVLLFGTHCGFGSMSEALYFGKPILAYPFHFDQFANAQRVLDIGMGVKVSPYNTNHSQVVESVQNMIREIDSYTLMAKKIGRRMRKAGGVRRAVEVCVDEIENGSEHLVYSQTTINDVVFCGALLLFIGVYLCGCCSLYCCSRCFQGHTKVKEE